MENKKYRVLLFRYPEEFEIEATSEIEAKEIAKRRIDWNVWDSIVEDSE